MIRRPPRSTLFPTRRSSDLRVFASGGDDAVTLNEAQGALPKASVYAGAGNDTVSGGLGDRKSTRLNSSHANISYAVFCLKKKQKPVIRARDTEHPHYAVNES